MIEVDGELGSRCPTAGRLARAVRSANRSWTPLTNSGHVGTVLDVTGPRLVTFGEIAGEVGCLIGRPIRYAELDPEAYVAALVAAGLPEPDAAGLAYLFTEVLEEASGAGVWHG
jgi:uncharacterized protein YbjT (DUF2867 family)